MKITVQIVLLLSFTVIGFFEFLFAQTSEKTETIHSDDRTPNIVLILSDDQGYGDFGFTGNDELKTPNLDQLHRESTTFSRFYVSPVCSPTRSGLLTGRYHQRTGVRGVIEGRDFMVEEETTIAELLSNEGYATGIFGKWHLGENYPWTPNAQGFDEFIGFLDGSEFYFDVDLLHNKNPFQTNGYLTDLLTDYAIGFMERYRDEPFFLFLPYNAPHTPLQVPDSYMEPYSHLQEEVAFLYGMIASLDENVGRLLNRMNELGLHENTILIFLSDNGPIFVGQRDQPNQRYNAGLRGAKYSVYEGGIRTPMMVRWPGQIQAGKNVDITASYIDLLPTILDYTDSALPDNVKLDGRSLRPLLENDADSWPERTLFMSYSGERRVEEETPYPGGMAAKGPYKMVDGTELYNLEEDPGETVNIADEQPKVMKQLKAEYEDYWREVTAGRDPYPRVHVGHPEENPVRLTAHWANLTLEEGPVFKMSDDPPRYRTVGVHGDRISRWSPEGHATWRLNVQAAGEYRISLILRMPAESSAEPTIQASIGDQTAVHKLKDVQGDQQNTWHQVDIGKVDIINGDADLRISVSEEGREVDLKYVVLERLSTSVGIQ
ncbi:MAG: sulfatase-like hydrolase/transferase [Bacteroidetes bacterium]|jgi:arylsulfatase A|nr:sulfatase-like hydrolase/transferase [Bacteroidota bacterium]